MTLPAPEPGGVAPAAGVRKAHLWWAAVMLLFGPAFGTNVATPLLPLYRHALDLTPTDVNAIFGVYALGLAPSLLLGGPASDRYGRLRILLPATALTGAASLFFVPGAHSALLLYIARFMQGLASGAAFSVGSAWLQDIVGHERAPAAARRASLALNAGFCLGPLTAGLLAEYGPAPLTLPYVVHAVLVAAVLVLSAAIGGKDAWRADRPRSPGAGLLPRPHLGPAARRVFRRTLIPTAICVYAFPSVAITVLPLVLPHRGHVVAFTGVLAAVTLGAGAAVQPVAHHLGRLRGAAGAALGAAGYGFGALAAAHQSALVVFVAGALLGAGGGFCLNAGLTLVHELSTAATRGACNGLFYTWAYVGFAAPVLTTAFVPTSHLGRPIMGLTVATALVAAWLAGRRDPPFGGS